MIDQSAIFPCAEQSNAESDEKRVEELQWHDDRVWGRDIFVIDKYFRIYFINALCPYGLQYDKAALTRTVQSKGKGFVVRRESTKVYY